MVGICVTTTALEWAPLVTLLPWKVPHRIWPGVAMALAAVASTAIICRWARRPVWPGLLFPVASILSSVVLLRSGWLGFRRGGVMWRGTLYPSSILVAGCRVKIP